MRLYIAGPMTGYENYNFDEFNRVSKILSGMGHEVYNPATSFEGRQDLPYDLYLRHALSMVTMVEGVVLLTGWGDSKGALTEVHAALSCELNLFFLYGNAVENAFLVPIKGLDHAKLTEIMGIKYLGGESVESNGVSEDTGGNPREAESREDNFVGILASGELRLEPPVVCETVEGGLQDHGSGHGRSQPHQGSEDSSRYRSLFPWHRPIVVGKPAD